MRLRVGILAALVVLGIAAWWFFGRRKLRTQKGPMRQLGIRGNLPEQFQDPGMPDVRVPSRGGSIGIRQRVERLQGFGTKTGCSLGAVKTGQVWALPLCRKAAPLGEALFRLQTAAPIKVGQIAGRAVVKGTRRPRRVLRKLKFW